MTVLDRDAFWCSGGARGVDDVGEVVRRHRAGRGAGWMRRDRRPLAVKLQPPNAGRVQSIAQPRRADQHRRPGIRQHEAQTLARVAGVERQIGAAGLEDGDERNHQLQRALQAHPHHPLRTNPKRAQLMRQLVGATLKLPVAELLIPKHDRNRVRRRRLVRRSAADRISSRPIATSGAATAASSRRTSRPARTSTLARSNRSLAYSITPLSPPGPPSALRSSAKLTDKSNFALAPATGSTRALSPASSSSTGALFCNANITWNSGWCANERAGLSASTSRSNGSSWWLYAAKLLARTRPIRSPKLGWPDVSVRSTSVLTKNPTKSSSARSVRPAIGLPIAMSSPAPSRLSSAASPACSTMNRLAPCPRPSSSNAPCSCAESPNSTLPPR